MLAMPGVDTETCSLADMTALSATPSIAAAARHYSTLTPERRALRRSLELETLCSTDSAEIVKICRYGRHGRRANESHPKRREGALAVPGFCYLSAPIRGLERRSQLFAREGPEICRPHFHHFTLCNAIA